MENIRISYPLNSQPVDFAVEMLKQSIKAKADETSIDIRIIDKITIDQNLSKLQPQGYHISRVSNNTLTITAIDECGAMYGTLDVSRQISNGIPLSEITEGLYNPHIKNRGIKFNIPLDARTPSYSDESDSAQKNIINMWDFEFWSEFIDELAMKKFNAISLWSLCPFPSMVHVEDYPHASLNDVKRTTRRIVSDTEGKGMSNVDTLSSLVTIKKMTIAEKITFWQKVMEYAKSRCIRFYIFTWNIFTYGLEDTPYKITKDMSNAVTADYYKKAVKAMLETYPLLAGIGVTPGEQMSRTEDDVDWLRKTYGEGVKEVLTRHPDRDFTFIHRVHYSNIESITKAYRDYPYNFQFSFKYSQAHMHSNIKPSFGNKFFSQLKDGQKTWLTLRNDDFYMYRWGDPDYARNYIKEMPPEEKLAGFFMGPDGYTWGREYISRCCEAGNQKVISKMWYSFTIWGQLAYNPDTDNNHFVNMLSERFGENIAESLFTAWKNASQIIPLFQCTHWRNLDYQCYPEACCEYIEAKRAVWFFDINEFTNCPSAPSSGYISVSDYCSMVVEGKQVQGITPLEVSEQISQASKTALELIIEIKEQGMSKTDDVFELEQTLGDIEAISYLGEYYALKLKAAVHLLLARKEGSQEHRHQAVDLLKTACEVWKKYSKKSAEMYKPQLLTRFKEVIDVQRFDENVQMDILIAEEY